MIKIYLFQKKVKCKINKPKILLALQLMHGLYVKVINRFKNKQQDVMVSCCCWNYIEFKLFIIQLFIYCANNVKSALIILFDFINTIMISSAQRSNQRLKNLSCLAFSFVLIFTTGIFVSETYYNKTINQSITSASNLKDNEYTTWGRMLPSANYIQKFTPYVYDDQAKPVPSNESVTYKYSFEYKNISFAQGNRGNIKYLNVWERVIQNDKMSNGSVKVVNLQAQKVFNYDYFAPDCRKFALMFNLMFKTLSEDYLNNFFAEYVYQYFFKNLNMVQKRIFNLLSFSQEKGKAIFQNQNYGLSSTKTLGKWVELNKYFRLNAPLQYPEYNRLASQLNLKDSQIKFIAGSSSTLSSLLTAINGSIKYKLWSRQYGYQCEGQFCSNQILAAAQLAYGFLTADSLFKELNLNKYSGEMNKTIPNNVQYSWFCSQNEQLTCLQDDSSIQFFSQNFLSNYSQVDFIFKNLDRPEIIQNRYQLSEETGKSITGYVLYLYNNVFNIPSTKAINLEINDDKVNYEPLKVSFTNYNHLQKIMDTFGDLIVTQFYSRGLRNRFIQGSPIKCQDYFTGDFVSFKGLCQKEGLDLTKDLQSMKTYVKAYLGLDYKNFEVITNMTSSQIYGFFYSGTSLFATQMQTMINDMVRYYKCAKYCNRQELLIKQWTAGSILSNLPKQYFINTTAKISDWDTKMLLNRFQPQLSNYKKVKFTISQAQAYQILSSEFGVFSIYTLMKMNNEPQGNLFQSIKNSDLLAYFQLLVLNVDFKGTYLKKGVNQYFSGYTSDIIMYKQQINQTLGGAPWLSQKISAIQMQNQPNKFNIINSGIYNQKMLRQISQIQDSKFSSFQYQVYKSKYEDVSQKFITTKQVGGSNLFGFRSRINQGDSIQGYMDFLYGPAVLSYVTDTKWKNQNNQEISVYKYEFKTTGPVKIDIEQLANKTVSVSKQSYFLVEPTTGLTCEFFIKYKVQTTQFYLKFSQAGNSFPIYSAQLKYSRPATEQMFSINNQQSTLSTLLLLSIILASISMAIFIVLVILYEKKSKSIKKNALSSMESLITQEISASLSKKNQDEKSDS